MYFEQFYLGCLSHASYLLGSDGVAVVVDPQRDVELYLKAAAEQSLRIEHIFETHLHADFVSGHQELAARTGARVYISREAQAEFPHIPIEDGFNLNFGRCRLQVLATPGHTPESVSLLVFDPEKGKGPWAVLTGDTLFIGDVGRPDLSPTHSPQQLASMLFDSLHQKLLSLPDTVLVYPAHGAGSLCGRNMRAERFSTIGTERLTNSALRIETKDEFVREITANLPARPDYFLSDAEINRRGAEPLDQLPQIAPLSPEQLSRIIESDEAIALDVRAAEEFAVGHVPRSVNIGLSGQFASWAGILFGLATPLVLIANSDDQIDEARTRLARIGIEQVVGFLSGGFESWRRSSMPIATVARIGADQVIQSMSSHIITVLDVRRPSEWEESHLEGAVSRPLDYFRVGAPDIPANEHVAVHCKSGYRSMIAASLLKRAGFTEVLDVIGGFDVLSKLPAAALRTPAAVSR